MGKEYANKGILRNKKPLKNIVYEIELSQLEKITSEEKEKYSKYKFKDLGYLALTWWYEKSNPIKNWHGFITVEELKEKIGEKQYTKFCQGKRIFVVQRRQNNKNISK